MVRNIDYNVLSGDSKLYLVKLIGEEAIMI